MVKVILDPGSAHSGNKAYATELTKIAAHIGADAIKWQLFTNKPPNIELPYEWFPDLVEYGEALDLEVFASTFDIDSYEIVKKNCSSIKFAYSMRDAFGQIEKAVKDFNEVYISGDVMTKFNPSLKVKKFYCIPTYPVPYEVNFDGIFPRFDGFSSHCLGTRQEIRAVEAGAKILEFHFTADFIDADCPDLRFAKKSSEAETLIKKVKAISCGY